MGCWKVMDLRSLRIWLWLPWTILLLAGLLTCAYYQFLNPQNCGKLFSCAVTDMTNIFPPETNPNPISDPDPNPDADPLLLPPSPLSSAPRPFKPLYNDTRRIAVCLVGGARMFEITGRTIRKHLLDIYNNTDVFLHAPLDKDSHKFTLLAGRRLRVARIFTPRPLPETRVINEVITAWGSPHGMQGLLQYFHLVEGCYGMVKKYEVQHKFRYDWIIRTRVDGYWNAPLPELPPVDENHYFVAAGSDFRGLNDRFGMGNAHTSRAANSRLSLLPLMHKRGMRGLNSESAYRAQLDVAGVPYKRIQVPFCIMTLRKEHYPPPQFGLLVLSMASRGPMSGTYCRPCDREANTTTSVAIVDGCMRDWDWPGVEGTRVKVCDGMSPWASNWRDIAGEVYERDMGGEGIRDFSARAMAECVSEMREFQMQWDVWDSPSPEVICKQAFSK